MKKIRLCISLLLLVALLLSACKSSHDPGAGSTDSTGESVETNESTESIKEPEPIVVKIDSGVTEGSDEFLRAPDGYLPFIYRDDGSLDDVVGDNACWPGYLYVKNLATEELMLVTNVPVRAFKATLFYLYCLTDNNRILQVSYIDGKMECLYVGNNGTISSMDFFENQVFFVEDGQIIRYSIPNQQKYVITQEKNYVSVYALSRNMLVATAKDGKTYSISQYQYPYEQTLLETEEALAALAERERLITLLTKNVWYASSLSCTFEKPEDIDPSYFFYSTWKLPGYTSNLSQEERAFLQKAWSKQGWSSDIKLPAAGMNEALSVLNITAKDLNLSDEWAYYDKIDAYYVLETYSQQFYDRRAMQVEKASDGIVKIYWEITGKYKNTLTGDIYNSVKMVTTLQETPNGYYYVLSNVPVG